MARNMKNNELTGAALDWAVAKCGGFDPETLNTEMGIVYSWGYGVYTPSTNWAQGGPIIEREKFDRITANVSGGFTASKKIVELLDDDSFSVRWAHGLGPTPLIAAMRCYVASKLGDDVDVPKELIK